MIMPRRQGRSQGVVRSPAVTRMGCGPGATST
jgi:hypothetical protein